MREHFVNIGNELIQEIQRRMSGKRLNDTQGTVNSLFLEADDKTLAILGSEVFTWLNRGRSPGKFAPPKLIQEWVQSKLGITGKENKQVAFLVNKKIKEEGTTIFKDPTKGLELEEVQKMGAALISQEIGREFLLKLNMEINSNLRRI